MSALSAEWQNFFVAELGATAALTGLLVVAISINLSRILSIDHLPRRAAEALMQLVGALVVESVAIVPEQPVRGLAAEIAIVGLVILLIPTFEQMRDWSNMQGVDLTRKIIRVLIGWANSLPFLVGGSCLTLGIGGGLHWVAAGVIASLVIGVWNSWILLVEILR